MNPLSHLTSFLQLLCQQMKLAVSISTNRLSPINLPQKGNCSQTHLSNVKIICLILKAGYIFFPLRHGRLMLRFDCKTSPNELLFGYLAHQRIVLFQKAMESGGDGLLGIELCGLWTGPLSIGLCFPLHWDVSRWGGGPQLRPSNGRAAWLSFPTSFPHHNRCILSNHESSKLHQ